MASLRSWRVFAGGFGQWWSWASLVRLAGRLRLAGHLRLSYAHWQTLDWYLMKDVNPYLDYYQICVNALHVMSVFYVGSDG